MVYKVTKLEYYRLMFSVILVKSTLLGVGKIGPSESFIRNLSESNLLIPGRHIQLEHTIGQGNYYHCKSI